MKKKENDKDYKEFDIKRIDRFAGFPSVVLILILKYWAAAAAVFFIVIGGIDIGLDFETMVTEDPIAIMSQNFILIVIISFGMSLLMNYPLRLFVRMIYNRHNNSYRYNMVNIKGFLSFVLCFLYLFVVTIILFYITVFLSSKGLVFDPFGTTGGAGIEPFTFGLCFIVVDAFFILIKNVIVYIFKVLKYKKQINED